jgi:ATP-dependent RNA helicase DeaD
MERFRLEVGNVHGVKPGNIVGAIANEAEIDSEYIGRIEIFDDYSTIDLPEGMPKELLKHLKTVWVSGQRLQISRLEPAGGPSPGGAEKRKPVKDKGGAARPQVRLEPKGKSRGAPSSKPAARRPPGK